MAQPGACSNVEAQGCRVEGIKDTNLQGPKVWRGPQKLLVLIILKSWGDCLCTGPRIPCYVPVEAKEHLKNASAKVEVEFCVHIIRLFCMHYILLSFNPMSGDVA